MILQNCSKNFPALTPLKPLLIIGTFGRQSAVPLPATGLRQHEAVQA